MHPQPVSGGKQRGAELFLFPLRNLIIYCFILMLTKNENQIVLPASQVKESRISLWLNRENVLFSSIMEEKVSNRQAVLISQALASFSILTCSVFTHWLVAVLFLCWFIVSLYLCKKGGLK